MKVVGDEFGRQLVHVTLEGAVVEHLDEHVGHDLSDVWHLDEFVELWGQATWEVFVLEYP